MGLAAARGGAGPVGALQVLVAPRIRNCPPSTLSGALGLCPADPAAAASQIPGAVPDRQGTGGACQRALHRRQGGGHGAHRAPLRADPTGADADRLVRLGPRYHHAVEGGIDRARALVLALAHRTGVEGTPASADARRVAPALPASAPVRRHAMGRGHVARATRPRGRRPPPQRDQTPLGGAAVTLAEAAPLPTKSCGP